MKLVRYIDGDGRAAAVLGALTDGAIVPLGTSDLTTILATSGDSTAELEQLCDSGIRDGRSIPAESVKLLAPIVPAALLCAGENYVDHLDEKPRITREGPETFVKLTHSVIGPDESVAYPDDVTSKLDYEVELGVVIGTAARNVSADEALGHVFGYTIVNDMTLRDRQVRLRPDGTASYALGVSKSFDGSAPVGPLIVTADEIPDPQSLAISSSVNGELRQSNSTANMIDGVAQVIAYYSRFLTLRPGFLLATGTPGGTGWGSDPELGGRSPDSGQVDRYLHPGDRVDCVIERIGTLTTFVTS
jgi:2-keto-4-pentenoate hydratase/2-oxohepta-3-ene-1,7-dioic acid hydratase in catechol pathway